ncbi:AmpG family muropeptide MFS transporter [Coleofasciculus sp. H7-2]|uniref:AmpG family muropeptide MFS transporter n=1 Tax=Coleofasciculus sp. H7-2 TaxID=3351545 RepID=UPI00366F51BC
MKATQPFLQVFQSRKLASLLLLGFSSGLPLYLTSRTLQAWMQDEKVDLASIGLFSLVGLPYSLKFLWSPLLDRFVPPFLGRRRGWLVLTQVGLLFAIAAMALQQPRNALQFLAINALIVAFLSATQDIAGDAYRTDVLEVRELGIGASTWVLGYRIAILVTSAVALILADRIPWSGVYLLMAALMGVGLITSFWAPEPKGNSDRPPTSLTDAVYLPFEEFFRRLGLGAGSLTLLFVLLYKVGDALVGNMATPFLLAIEFTKTDIGAIQGGMGFLATTVGVIGGGLIVTRIGINRSLWLFGALQAFSNLGYFALATAGKNYSFLVLAINLENLCAGLVTAAFVAYLMSLCNQRFSATQFALLSSLMAVCSIILAAPAGHLAKATGWPGFFLISLIAALPGLLLLPFVAPWNPRFVPEIPREALDDEDDDSQQL